MIFNLLNVEISAAFYNVYGFSLCSFSHCDKDGMNSLLGIYYVDGKLEIDFLFIKINKYIG